MVVRCWRGDVDGGNDEKRAWRVVGICTGLWREVSARAGTRIADCPCKLKGDQGGSQPSRRTKVCPPKVQLLQTRHTARLALQSATSSDHNSALL